MKFNQVVLSLTAALAAATIAACEKKPAAAPTPTKSAAGDQHTGREGHAHAETGDHHGTSTPLGTVQIGTYEVTAKASGAVQAGKEVGVELSFSGSTGPVAVRVWIGTQDGAGSLKSRAEREDHGYHAHVESPDPLPEGSKLWVEVESSDGGTASGAFDLAPR